MIRHLAIFLTALLLAPLAIVHAADAPESNRKSKPNIVLILADDMGLMDTSRPFMTDDKTTPVKPELP